MMCYLSIAAVVYGSIGTTYLLGKWIANVIKKRKATKFERLN